MREVLLRGTVEDINYMTGETTVQVRGVEGSIKMDIGNVLEIPAEDMTNLLNNYAQEKKEALLRVLTETEDQSFLQTYFQLNSEEYDQAIYMNKSVTDKMLLGIYMRDWGHDSWYTHNPLLPSRYIDRTNGRMDIRDMPGVPLTVRKRKMMFEALKQMENPFGSKLIRSFRWWHDEDNILPEFPDWVLDNAPDEEAAFNVIHWSDLTKEQMNRALDLGYFYSCDTLGHLPHQSADIKRRFKHRVFTDIKLAKRLFRSDFLKQEDAIEMLAKGCSQEWKIMIANTVPLDNNTFASLIVEGDSKVISALMNPEYFHYPRFYEKEYKLFEEYGDYDILLELVSRDRKLKRASLEKILKEYQLPEDERETDRSTWRQHYNLQSYFGHRDMPVPDDLLFEFAKLDEDWAKSMVKFRKKVPVSVQKLILNNPRLEVRILLAERSHKHKLDPEVHKALLNDRSVRVREAMKGKKK